MEMNEIKCGLCGRIIEDHTAKERKKCIKSMVAQRSVNIHLTDLLNCHPKNHREQVIARVNTTYLLEEFKDSYQLAYNSLSEIVGLPVTVVCRYINGHVLPNQERAIRIIKKIEERINNE